MTIETEMKVEKTTRHSIRYLKPLRNLSLIFTPFLLGITYFDYLPWQIAVKDADNQLKSLSMEDRWIFTVELSFVDLIPLFWSIIGVIGIRMRTVAVNPLDPRSDRLVDKRQRILQNTLEQTIIKIILSFVLCSVVRENEFLLLPVFTFLFLLGRLTFDVGYPNYRSFGMGMNFTAASIFIFFISFRLFYEKLLFRFLHWK